MTATSIAAAGAYRIAQVSAVEILDSRCRPTLLVTVTLADGIAAAAGVPSGVSVGSGEAAERRDGDLRRYHGLGVCGAVEAVRGSIADRLRGQEWRSLEEIDAALTGLDGTPAKARLGANAIVGVPMACARALTRADGRELWDWLAPHRVAPQLPVPPTVVAGGVHPRDGLDFQEVMVAPLGAPSLMEAIRAGAEVYEALGALLADRGHATSLGDDGGFALDAAASRFRGCGRRHWPQPGSSSSQSAPCSISRDGRRNMTVPGSAPLPPASARPRAFRGACVPVKHEVAGRPKPGGSSVTEAAAPRHSRPGSAAGR